MRHKEECLSIVVEAVRPHTRPVFQKPIVGHWTGARDMKYRLMALAFPVIALLPMAAQEYPGIEFFVGGSVASTNVIGRESAAGWQINTAFNPHRRLRLVGDFGEQSQKTSLKWQGQPLTIRNYQILFGPEFTLRRERLTWFAHPLAGMAAAEFATPTNQVPANDFGFASELGGGLDVNVNQVFAIRVFQLDYVLSHMHAEDPTISALKPSDLPPLSDWQSGVRVGFGIVIRLDHHEAR